MSKSLLPGTWTKATLCDIAEINPRHSKELDDSLPVSFAPMVALSEFRPKFDFLAERPLREVRKGFTHFAEGDVLFAKITPCMENGKGAVAIGLRNGLGCGTTELHVLRPRGGVDPHYLYHFLHQESFRRAAESNFTGTAGQARVPTAFMKEAEISLAPLNEQRRIVAKLEKLLDNVDSCQKRLAKIPILLKRFRQAVVAAACSGELTSDWREKSVSCSEFEDLDLPGGWNWQTIRNLVGPSGLFDGPFGSNLKTADYTGHGVRVVRLENIGHLKFLNEKKAFISEQKYQNLRKHTVRDGDIIFSSFIDEEIRVCVLPPLPTRAIAKADCFCLRPSRDSVDIRYLTLQLASPATYNRLLEKVHGATRPRINTTQLRDLIVPVCPPNEQHEIVRRVDELFALADQVEARFSKAKQYVDALKQSIVAKAFRGDLVPQDPKDEPASNLLERIREARGTKPMNRQPAKMRT